MVRLGNIVEQIRGVSYKPSDLSDQLDENSVILLRANNIQDGKLVFDDLLYVSKNKVSSNQYLKQGDILVCTSSGSKELVGKAVYIENDLPMVFGAFCKVVRPNAQDSKYIGHFFQSPYYRRNISAVSAGANINNLRNEHIANLNIFLPPLDEQRRVAATLDKVTDLISKRRQQLDKLDELVKSRFVEMFGDPVNNPMKWSVHCFSEYIEFLTSGSRGWAKYFTEQGEYFITIKNVKNCRVTVDNVQHIIPPDNAEAKRTKVQEGDLLISITADLGRTGVISKEIADHGAYINQHLTCIRAKKDCLNPVYAAYYLESEAGKSQFQSKNQSAVKAGLNFNAINSLQLMVPPLTLQNTFVDFVNQTEKTKDTIISSLEKLETMKKALMQEYFK